MPPNTRADRHDTLARAHMAVAGVLFQRTPDCLFRLVAAFRAGVQGKLQLSFDGTLKGSSLHWEQVPVLSVASMGDLPRGAFTLAPSAQLQHTVPLEVLTADEAFVYAVPLQTFFGAADAADMERRIVEFEGLFGPVLKRFTDAMTVTVDAADRG